MMIIMMVVMMIMNLVSREQFSSRNSLTPGSSLRLSTSSPCIAVSIMPDRTSLTAWP